MAEYSKAQIKKWKDLSKAVDKLLKDIDKNKVKAGSERQIKNSTKKLAELNRRLASLQAQVDAIPVDALKYVKDK